MSLQSPRSSRSQLKHMADMRHLSLNKQINPQLSLRRCTSQFTQLSVPSSVAASDYSAVPGLPLLPESRFATLKYECGREHPM